MQKSDLRAMTRKDLMDMAKEKGVAGRSKMDKEALVSALSGGSAPPPPPASSAPSASSSPPPSVDSSRGSDAPREESSGNRSRSRSRNRVRKDRHSSGNAQGTHEDEVDPWNSVSARDPNYGRFLDPGQSSMYRGGGGNRQGRPGGRNGRPGGGGNRPADGRRGRPAERGGLPVRNETLAERSERGRDRAHEKSGVAKDALRRTGEARRESGYTPQYEKSEERRGRGPRSRNNDRRGGGRDRDRDRDRDRKSRTDSNPERRGPSKGGRGGRDGRGRGPDERNRDRSGRDRNRGRNNDRSRSDQRSDPKVWRESPGVRGAEPANAGGNPREARSEERAPRGDAPQPLENRPVNRDVVSEPSPLESLGVVGPVDQADLEQELASIRGHRTENDPPKSRRSRSGRNASREGERDESESLDEQSGVTGHAVELPSSYETDRCRILPRDPYWLHAYWELTEESLDQALRELDSSDCRPILRVHSVPTPGSGDAMSQPAGFFDVEIDNDATSWYIHVGIPQREYRVDVGLLDSSGLFYPLATSNRAVTPPDGMSNRIDPNWSNSEAEAEEIYGASGGSPAGQITRGPMPRLGDPVPMPSNPTDSDVEESAAPPNNVALEARAKSQASEAPSPSGGGWVSSPAPASGSGPYGASEGFFLGLNTELLISGTTFPGATVAIGGVSAKVRSDGSFSVRFQLPDGEQEIPIVAVSGDGVEERGIIAKVARVTEVYVREREPSAEEHGSHGEAEVDEDGE